MRAEWFESTNSCCTYMLAKHQEILSNHGEGLSAVAVACHLYNSHHDKQRWAHNNTSGHRKWVAGHLEDFLAQSSQKVNDPCWRHVAVINFLHLLGAESIINSVEAQWRWSLRYEQHHWPEHVSKRPFGGTERFKWRCQHLSDLM